MNTQATYKGVMITEYLDLIEKESPSVTDQATSIEIKIIELNEKSDDLRVGMRTEFNLMAKEFSIDPEAKLKEVETTHRLARIEQLWRETSLILPTSLRNWKLVCNHEKS